MYLNFDQLRALLAAICLAGHNACPKVYENPGGMALDDADMILECCGLVESDLTEAVK